MWKEAFIRAVRTMLQTLAGGMSGIQIVDLFDDNLRLALTTRLSIVAWGAVTAGIYSFAHNLGPLSPTTSLFRRPVILIDSEVGISRQLTRRPTLRSRIAQSRNAARVRKLAQAGMIASTNEESLHDEDGVQPDPSIFEGGADHQEPKP